MEYPGNRATGEQLEEWLDATLATRKECEKTPARWKRIEAARLGDTDVFECGNCGRLSKGAEKKCWPLVGDRGKWR